MTVRVFTENWAKQWQEQLNNSTAYRSAANTWEWPLIITLQKDASAGIDEDASVYLDLYRGECRTARMATEEDVETAPFVISADPHTWKQVFDRQLEPLTGMMRGKLKLEKGNMSVLTQYVLAAKELVECSMRIDAELPEGMV